MNSAYGDWWESWTSPVAVAATVGAAIAIPFELAALPVVAGAAGLAVAGAAATDAYNWYYAAPSASAPLSTSPPAVKPADYALQQQQAAQIEAALARYNKDPAALAPPTPSWVWPAVAVAGIGAVVYAMSASKRGRDSYRSQR